MEIITVELLDRQYTITIGDGAWDQALACAEMYDKVFLITDENVAGLYGSQFPYPQYVMTPGEEGKTMETALAILDEMVRHSLTRNSLVLALGGGVVGDVAGFCGSVYMRGIDYVQIPTTLLAQVDSSIGGKTGVNTVYGKNLIGTFHQPQGVYIDPAVLNTLPKKEVVNGLGEVIKYGIIGDPDFFEYLKNHLHELLELKPQVVFDVLCQCCSIKAQIVAEDEKDQGERKILNFGHTIGHALEAVTEYKGYTHGEAVLIGMLYEARLANALGLLPGYGYEEIREVLETFDLNWSIQHLPEEAIFHVMMQDKKNCDGQISFILPIQPGQVQEMLLTPEQMRRWWRRIVS